MIQLGDRDIHVTLKRALRALTVWDKVKLAWTFMSDSIESVTAEDLESLKNSDVVTELFLELGQEQPRLLEPLL
jgi:pheromone shutdown protein TraB